MQEHANDGRVKIFQAYSFVSDGRVRRESIGNMPDKHGQKEKNHLFSTKLLTVLKDWNILLADIEVEC